MSGSVPGAFWPMKKLLETDKDFGRVNSDLLKPSWHYLVPRSMLYTAYNMLTAQQQKDWRREATRAHEKVYHEQEETVRDLARLIGTGRHFRRLLKRLDKRGYRDMGTHNETHPGKVPENVSELVCVLVVMPSLINPMRPVWSLRDMSEMYDLLKDAEVPEACLDCLEKLWAYYNPGKPRLDKTQPGPPPSAALLADATTNKMEETKEQS